MKVFLVGGAVRDELLGIPVKERDWVVVGATPELMKKQGFRSVGKDFPVFLHPETKEEYALARSERKVAPGYHGFVFETDPDTTLEEDLRRRDLTINAMARDDQGKLIDPYGGHADLSKRILRHVSDAFVEDPVRVLRVARFHARYVSCGFHVHQDTLELMQTMSKRGEISALVPERVWREITLALSSPMCGVFFKTLQAAAALEILAKELDVVFRQYGDELVETMNLASKKSLSPKLMFSILASWSAQAQQSLTTWCQHVKAPTDYRRLTYLLPSFHALLVENSMLEANTLWHFFKQNDLIRNPNRFYRLEKACAFYPLPEAQERHSKISAALKAMLQLDFAEPLKKNDRLLEIKKTVKSLQVQAICKILEH